MTKDSYHTYYPSPIGILKINFNNQALLKIEFDDHLREVKNNCQKNFYEDPEILIIYNLIFDQLNQYFLGKRNSFEIPFQLDGSPFELKVWNFLQTIPYGKTYSYLELAAAVGKPEASQAVAKANSKNPIAVIIPSHRVISADGKIKNYSGGVWRKEWLLKHENNKSKKIERKISFV
ncbi:methylated-DNA-[protein]-cysteine S-methyltransferase [Halanaerobium saccharolyticum]|uniref:methylated-DNA--[protein]-cysteine S-methyltransferase n=1 Tax=Halanaerobium saccharolyticum TaxID=43595 RepID=A0A4R7Z7Z8_9FIRM|nr:methylated-DNA-[protein]-cysteine S-methyltransferase [Halanaerobium saccharolyticum]TDW06999.1 methylated-DNA-[protein]-cysteine S-methyltransferase [Halanaerobium saccharolyticum]TDX63764.1 methylated-DNA-[protein]-cysteine S-methyltransferase [Halanaerobium saccharolyticum]